MTKEHKRVKYGCYAASLSMSVVGNLSPLLFLTFRNLYGISYSLLGLLVLINFCTQLAVDLVFSFFSHKFDIKKTVKFTPVLTVIGLSLFALAPYLFPGSVYTGLVLGTLLFASSSGLCEVLLSPVIAALPAKDPDREMSKLHSIYAWGVVGVVIFSTLFIYLFGEDSWSILTFIFTALPITATVLLFGANIPDMQTPEKTSGAIRFLKNSGVWLCVFAMFLGGAAECIMAQWCSGYLEAAVGLPKLFGDVFGVALFSLMLGLGRTLYAKFGKNIYPVLFFCAVGATACYFTAAVSSLAIVGLVACALTGFFTSMLWPGNLIAATDRFPTGGVLIYALMASGGDLGASVGPQLVGIVTDWAIATPVTNDLAATMGVTAEQLGMKLGMLIGMIFPLVAIVIFSVMWKGKCKRNKQSSENAEA